MRRTWIASSVAVLALAGIAGGAAYAAESSGAPEAAPTSSLPGQDILTSLGLEPEQIECLAANLGSVDMNDQTALTDVMTQCGLTTDQISQIGQAIISTSLPEATAATTLESIPPAAFDPATVAALFELLGLDEATVDCVVSETEFAEPTDDAAAEAVLNNCGVGPLQVVEAIVALDAQSGAFVTEDSVVVEDTVTGSLEPPVSVASSGNAMVDLLLEQLDPAQAQCVLDNMSEFDLDDLLASIDVLETCGIDITELIPGG
jgi:hypothetical protein